MKEKVIRSHLEDRYTHLTSILLAGAFIPVKTQKMAEINNLQKVASDPIEISSSPQKVPVDVNSTDEVTKHHSNVDDALRMLEAGPALGSIDPQTKKRLLRRIDLYIMPLICM